MTPLDRRTFLASTAASMNAKYPLQYAVWRDGTATVQTAKAVFS